jgi:ABC-2 type transport system permease protein
MFGKVEFHMFNIVVKETKEFVRDKTNLFFFMMFPVILVFLLGNLLTSMDKSEETIGEIKIQYLVETVNPYQAIAIQSFVKEAGDGSNLFFEEAKNLETGRQLAGNDEITAVVVFNGDPLEIQVYEGTNHIKNRTVGAILNSFVQTNKSITAVMNTSPEALVNRNTVQEDYVIQKDLGVNRTMIDYYAVSMVAMIGFMSILLGAVAFVGERQDKTINRLIITPQNRISLFLQKILGMVPQVVLQITVIMTVSVFVFNAHYATTIGANLYLFFMFLIVTLCMVSIGAAIGIVIKANPMAVIMPVLWLMMFFGGTYSKEINIKGITNKMPIYQLQQAAFDLAIFNRFGKANTVILICLLVMAAALIFGAFLFSNKKEEK